MTAFIPLWASTTLVAALGIGVGMLILPAIQRLTGGGAKKEEKSLPIVNPAPAVPTASMPSPEAEQNQKLQRQLQAQDRRLGQMEEEIERERSDHRAEMEAHARTRDQLNVEIETHARTRDLMNAERESHVGTRDRLSAELEQKDLVIQELRQSREQQSSLAREYRDRLASLQEMRAVCEAVRADRDRLPLALLEFADALLALDAFLGRADVLDQLSQPENIDRLDRYVYRALPPPGLVIAEPDRSLQCEDLPRLVALQGLIHERLCKIGMMPILPTTGDPYEMDRHISRDEDLIWINDDPRRHNRVASVKRIGYRSGDQVIRKAEVRRFMFLGQASVPADAPPTDAVPAAFVPPIEEPPLPVFSATDVAAPTDVPEAAVLPMTRSIAPPLEPEEVVPPEPTVGRISAASLLTSEPPLPSHSVQENVASTVKGTSPPAPLRKTSA
jgi:hypothetical protein